MSRYNSKISLKIRWFFHGNKKKYRPVGIVLRVFIGQYIEVHEIKIVLSIHYFPPSLKNTKTHRLMREQMLRIAIECLDDQIHSRSPLSLRLSHRVRSLSLAAGEARSVRDDVVSASACSVCQKLVSLIELTTMTAPKESFGMPTSRYDTGPRVP